MTKKKKNLRDPQGRDAFTREYFQIENESTSDFLIRMGCTSTTPEGRLKMWEYSLPGIATYVSASTQSLFNEMVSLINEYKLAIDTRPLGELDELRLEKAQFLCEKITVIHDTSPMLEANRKYSAEQRSRASKLRVLDDEKADRIYRQYCEHQRNGTLYGAVKELAATYNVSVTTIHDVIKRRKK